MGLMVVKIIKSFMLQFLVGYNKVMIVSKTERINQKFREMDPSDL